MSTDQYLRIGSPDSECWASVGIPESPHGDELTLFDVRLEGPGLDARVGVESLSGDCGFRIDDDPAGPHLEGVRLADWLHELGASKPWSGSIGWRSLADELRFQATCDALGHVDLTVEVRPRPWSPPWFASITVTYALGDLIGLADSVAAWFGDAARSS